MVLRSTICIFATFFLVSHFQTADGEELFQKDGSEYAVKTIQTEHGDLYDCVDFYKQPAFNHPLLKNNTFTPQTRPSSRPKSISNIKNLTNMNELPAGMIRLKDGGCPKGTVPIRRITDKDDLEMLQQHSVEKTSQNDVVQFINGTVFAISQTKSDPSKQYYGVGGTLTIYNPRAMQNQYSSAEVIIKGGSDVITVGWTVNPSKYKDNKTRFFISTVAGDKKCFNSECGFITVREDIPLDFLVHPVSKIGGTIYTYPVFVYQDEKNGNWWLEVSSSRLTLGFWPQRIFQGLYNGGTYAACGGEVNSIATLPPPEMGAGTYPATNPDPKLFAYCKDFVVVDGIHNIVFPPSTERFLNSPAYGCNDYHEGHSRLVYFGGPGN